LGLVDGLAPVHGLADHVEVGLGVEDHAEAGAHQGLVVGDEDSDAHAASLSFGIVARTRNPPPCRGPACRSPPHNATRSRMPTRPWPTGPSPSNDAAVRPWPVSEMSSSRWSSVQRSSTVA